MARRGSGWSLWLPRAGFSKGEGAPPPRASPARVVAALFFCGLGSLGGKSGLPPALRVLDEADTSLPPCSLGPPSLAAFSDVATALGGSEPAPSTLQLALSSGGRLPRKGHRLVQRSVNEQPNQFLPEAAAKREEQQGKWEGNYITEHCETASSTTIRYGARHRNLSGAGRN